MSEWFPTTAYDVAYIDHKALVLVRGGNYYNLARGEIPAWRQFAVAKDVDDARRIAKAMNATLAAAGVTQGDSGGAASDGEAER